MSTSVTKPASGTPRWPPTSSAIATKIHIINLEKSLPLFPGSQSSLKQLAANRGTILMVGTSAKPVKFWLLKRNALACFRGPALAGRHAHQLQDGETSIKRLKDMKAQLETGLET